MENEAFCSPKPKKAPETLKKHYLEKVFASRFREVKNLIKPMENQLFQKSKKPYVTNGK